MTVSVTRSWVFLVSVMIDSAKPRLLQLEKQRLHLEASTDCMKGKRNVAQRNAPKLQIAILSRASSEDREDGEQARAAKLEFAVSETIIHEIHLVPAKFLKGKGENPMSASFTETSDCPARTRRSQCRRDDPANAGDAANSWAEYVRLDR